MVTFASYRRWYLPVEARKIILGHCLHENGRKFELLCAVVMTDHVHLLYRPLADARGNFFGIPEIVGAIKSVSAHEIVKSLDHKGPVWQAESHDHVLRQSEDVGDVANYICNNPVRKGLCKSWEEYPFLWREWVDGRAGGSANQQIG